MTILDQELLIAKEHARTRESHRIEGSKSRFFPHQGQDQDHRHLKEADDGPIVATKQDGGGFDADLKIILSIHHGVHGVVDQSPKDGGKKEHPDDWGEMSYLGCEAHRNRPTKCDTQIGLRKMGVALRKGVTCGQEGTGDGKDYR